MSDPGQGWRRAFHGRPPRREVDDELRFHMEEEVARLVAGGLAREEARRRVAREFRELDRIRRELGEMAEERRRRERRGNLVESIWRDGLLAARRLSRAPGFAAAAILTLALGIGATVAMFSVVEGVILRPLPYPDSHRLIRVWPAMNFNIALVDRFREASSYERITGLSRWSFNLTGEGEPEQLDGIAVDPDYFEVFGVRPALGRGFGPHERFYGQDEVVILGWDLWRRRFGGDPAVLGRRIDLDGHGALSREVVGVMPQGHHPPGQDVDLWVPLSTAPGYTVAQDSSWYVNEVVARLAPEATVEEARAEVRTLARRVRSDFPGRIEEEMVAAADARRLLDSMVGDVRFGLWVMLAAVGLVLLMACTNVANLLLARSAERSGDLAIRSALGATRGRLLRQLLVEAGLLAALGGSLGVILAWWGLSAFRSGVAMALPRGGEASLSLPVLAFAAVVTGASVLVFAVLPALRSASADVAAELKERGRSGLGGPSSGRARRGLVAVQVALAVVLVAGAGLLLRSFWSLYRTDPGFEAEGVLAVRAAGAGGETPARRAALAAYYEEVERRLERVPGVASVGGIHLLPLRGGNWAFPYLAEGHPPPSDGPLPTANFRIVTPGYFRTLGIPLLSGRDVTWRDGREGARVGLLNRTMARELWPGEEAVGKVVRLFGNMEFTVVGVVGDVRQFSLDREAVPEIYWPLHQFSPGPMNYLVRARTGDPSSLAPAVREAIWEVDSSVPITLTAPLSGIVNDSVARSRFFAALLAGFGALAFFLGAVGVYGVSAHHVAGRMREFGLRMALGAGPAGVIRNAVGRGMVPVALGLGGGSMGALLAGGLLEGLLYRVSPWDPATHGVVVLVLGGVALVATWLPARRASRVDPMRALGSD